MIPQSSEADVQEAFARARRAQQAWAQTTLEHRSQLLLRLHDLVLDRQDEIIDLICWESGKARKHAFDEPPAHRADRALLRAHGPRPPRHRAQARRRARADPGRGQPRAQGRGRHHLAVELPVHDGAVRRPAGAARRQRRGHQARRPDDALARCSAPSCSRRPASRRASGTSSPGPAASSVRRSSSAPTTSASPAPPPPAS